MNWKGYGRKLLSELRWYLCICLKGLRKTTETSMMIACHRSEILIRHVQSTQQYYHVTVTFSYKRCNTKYLSVCILFPIGLELSLSLCGEYVNLVETK
jgi:hypothetical protein